MLMLQGRSLGLPALLSVEGGKKEGNLGYYPVNHDESKEVHNFYLHLGAFRCEYTFTTLTLCSRS